MQLRPLIAPAVSIAILVALIVAARTVFVRPRTGDQPRPQVRWRALETRPTLGRLAGLEGHRPYVLPPMRSAPLAEPGPSVRGASIDATISRRSIDEAVLALLENRGCPAAPLLLRSAAEQRTGDEDWALWNDLAVARLACAPSAPAQALTYQLEALEAVSRALDLQPDAAEARFNHALLLELLTLEGRAQSSWQAYLQEIDDDTGWAEEARARLAALAHTTDTASPLIGLRDRAERFLLPRWADARARGPAGSPALRTQLDAIVEQMGPAGTLHAAAISTLADAGTATARAATLALGHRLFAQGMASYRAEQAAAARIAFTRATAAFEQAGSPFWFRSELRRLWAAREPELATIEALILDADRRGFHWASAEGTRLLAWRVSRRGESIRALALYAEAERRFAAVGASEEEALVASMRAQLLMKLDRPEEAFQAMTLALPRIPRMADAWNRYAALWVSADAVRQIAPRASTEIQWEILSVCDDLPERPLCRLDLLIALTRRTLPLAQAEDILDQAEIELRTVGPNEGQARTRVDLQLARARLLLRTPGHDAARKALRLATAAVDYFEQNGLRVPAVGARLTLATSLEALGRHARARGALDLALDRARHWNTDQHVLPGTQATGTPEALRALFERLIVLTSNQGDHEQAFLLAEEMRHRVAPRLAVPRSPPIPRDLAELRASIPAHTALVEYAVTLPHRPGEPARALAWLLTRDRFVPLTLNGADELAPRLARLRKLGDARALQAWREQSAAIHRQWIEPVLGHLPEGTRSLVIVPDSELFDLPFRALYDPSSGRYLDERLEITLAPSLGTLLTGNDRETGSPPTILSLGFDTFAGRGHRALPAARDEARAVGRVYGTEHVLACPDETWTELRGCLPHAAVVHFATHAAARTGTWGRSWLALPEEDLDLKRLWQELPPLPATELVVLAACTSLAAPAGGEGLGGLARPFLAHGARAVAGTLRPIEDDIAQILFPAFHQAYARSGNPALALQEAREHLPGWHARPWAWGPLEVIVRTWNPPTETRRSDHGIYPAGDL